MISVTILICIFTGFISYQGFSDRSLFERLKHYPYSEKRNKDFFRMLSSGFLHGDMAHLLLNMYVLYIFGTSVEGEFVNNYGSTMGRAIYLVMYLSAIIFADIPSYIKHKDNPSFASIGASGAVSAILFTYILFNPWNILLLFFIIPCPAILAGIGYLVYSSHAAKNSRDRIDHLAHLSGAVYGIFASLVIFSNQIPYFIEQLTRLPNFSSIF
jgi:membrane associated rhomboid family serine protease